MEKEYFTVEETAKLLGRGRGTVYNRMTIIKLKGHRFMGDRKTYLSKEEVEQLRSVFTKPWTAPEKREVVA